MNTDLLELLRCPFCGTRLRLLNDRSLSVGTEGVDTGVLCCACCAYPVVAGIPFLRMGQVAETAMCLLGDGAHDQALFTLLELEETKRPEWERIRCGPRVTFREALALLSPNAEGDYLLYRFSDPTFLCSEAVLRAVRRDQRCAGGRVLDLCGGTGHLTRSLCRGAAGTEVVLADLSFWKLWLARRFLAPSCRAVCCDATQPLPFARETFALVFCSDAFHFVWTRRLLAGEMLRLLGSSGAVVLPHLHNLLYHNPSAGMPLAPADYRSLFEDIRPQLFKESTLLDSILAGRPVDLSESCADEDLNAEPALVLIAARPEGNLALSEGAGEEDPERPLAVNPCTPWRRTTARGSCGSGFRRVSTRRNLRSVNATCRSR
jgi:uncharacterized protein YbaR (Trm112 family)/SAM-dependent methyltransferase